MTETDQFTHAIVPFDWSFSMRAAAENFASRMSQDPERRLTIVALLEKAWPEMLSAVPTPPNRAIIQRDR